MNSLTLQGTYHLKHFFDLKACHVLGQFFKILSLPLTTSVFQWSSFIHLAFIQECTSNQHQDAWDTISNLASEFCKSAMNGYFKILAYLHLTEESLNY